jgi:hypothetical protein
MAAVKEAATSSLAAVAAPLAGAGGDTHCESWMERIGDNGAMVEVTRREGKTRGGGLAAARPKAVRSRGGGEGYGGRGHW